MAPMPLPHTTATCRRRRIRGRDDSSLPKSVDSGREVNATPQFCCPHSTTNTATRPRRRKTGNTSETLHCRPVKMRGSVRRLAATVGIGVFLSSLCLERGVWGVYGQLEDGGVVSMSCEICDCTGSADDGTDVAVFQNPSQDVWVAEVDGEFYSILYSTCGPVVIGVGDTVYQLEDLDLPNREVDVIDMSSEDCDETDIASVPDGSDCFSGTSDTIGLQDDITLDITHYVSQTSPSPTSVLYKVRSDIEFKGSEDVVATVADVCTDHGFLSQVATITAEDVEYNYNWEMDIPDSAQPSAEMSVTDAPSGAESFVCGADPTPAPVRPATPAPIPVPETPSPIMPDTPSPVMPDTPSPVMPDTPSPVMPDTPAPVVPETPAPVVPPTPEPTPAPTTPLPTPAPIAPLSTPAPFSEPEPTPQPVPEETPAPEAAPTPAPVVPETPVPVAVVVPSSPAPVVAETVAPVAEEVSDTAAPVGREIEVTPAPVRVTTAPADPPTGAPVSTMAPSVAVTPGPVSDQVTNTDQACELPDGGACWESANIGQTKIGIGYYYDPNCNTTSTGNAKGCVTNVPDKTVCRICIFNTEWYTSEREDEELPDYVTCPCCVSEELGHPAADVNGAICDGSSSPSPSASPVQQPLSPSAFGPLNEEAISLDNGQDQITGSEGIALVALGLFAVLTFFPMCAH